MDTSKKLIEGNKLLEVHCVAICYNKSKNKVFLFKKGSHLNNFPGKWKFGCFEDQNEKTIPEIRFIAEFEDDREE